MDCHDSSVPSATQSHNANKYPIHLFVQHNNFIGLVRFMEENPNTNLNNLDANGKTALDIAFDNWEENKGRIHIFLHNRGALRSYKIKKLEENPRPLYTGRLNYDRLISVLRQEVERFLLLEDWNTNINIYIRGHISRYIEQIFKAKKTESLETIKCSFVTPVPSQGSFALLKAKLNDLLGKSFKGLSDGTDIWDSGIEHLKLCSMFKIIFEEE